MKSQLTAARTARNAVMLTAAIFLAASPAAAESDANASNPPAVESKAVHITGARGQPYVIDDEGHLWGTSVDSRLFRMNYYADPAHLEKMDGDGKFTDVVSDGWFGLALKEDGTVWTVDYVESSGSEIDQWGPLTPKVLEQVSHLQHIQKINICNGNALAVDRDGNLWIWETAPQRVRNDPLFAHLHYEPELVKGVEGVKDVLTRYDTTAILKEDGTVWTWNTFRADPYVVIASQQPEQLKELTDIVKLGNYVALKKDGTVWVWGNSFLSCRLVDGYGICSPPSQVDGLSDITDVSAGDRNILAVKKDGTVWKTGYFPKNFEDRQSPEYSPVSKVEGLTDVAAVSGGEPAAAIKKDGTLWMWGYDAKGLFGNDGMVEASPVQVPLRPSPLIPH